MDDSDDTEQVLGWLRAWARCIRERDFDAGHRLFDPDVVSFGTFVAVAQGIDELEREQWRRTWPFIDNFRFDHEAARVFLSPDRLLATVAVGWSSVGVGADGKPFGRPGRASLVVLRTTPNAEWRAVHTHFSLSPGTAIMASHQLNSPPPPDCAAC